MKYIKLYLFLFIQQIVPATSQNFWKFSDFLKLLRLYKNIFILKCLNENSCPKTYSAILWQWLYKNGSNNNEMN